MVPTAPESVALLKMNPRDADMVRSLALFAIRAADRLLSFVNLQMTTNIERNIM